MPSPTKVFNLLLTLRQKYFQSVMEILQTFKRSRFVSPVPDFEESWLSEFLNSSKKKAEILSLDPKELLNEENFMKELVEFMQVHFH